MKEIEVGIRIRPGEGIRFFGMEEVNELIRRGARVVAIEPGDAILNKIGEDGDKVRLVLGGCNIRVILDDSGVLKETLTDP